MKNFSSDIQLIIQCCQHNTNAEKIKSLIPQITQWETFIDLAFTHGVFPLVYRELKKYSSLIPQETLTIMKTYNMNIVKENMLMSAELIKVMKILEDNNIEALAFKGPTLAQMAYGDITLRQYADLDILVKKEKLKKVMSLLSQEYQTTLTASHIENELFLEIAKDITFFNKKNNIHIELHWKLLETRFFEKNDFNSMIWSAQEKITLNGYKIPSLANDVLIIYLMIHGSKHAWERIEWLTNIAMILQKKPTNFELLFHYAKTLNSVRMFLLTLYLLNNLYAINIPNSVKSKIDKDKKLKKIAHQVYNNWNHVHQLDTTALFDLQEIKFIYSIQDSLYLKLKVLIKLIFQIKIDDIKTVNFSKKFTFIYYIIRPYRVVVSLIKKIK